MDFFNDIFHNLALLEFYFFNIIYILLYIDFILSIFFQHSNILTRASHHWCLASNIVLVSTMSSLLWSRANREWSFCIRCVNISCGTYSATVKLRVPRIIFSVHLNSTNKLHMNIININTYLITNCFWRVKLRFNSLRPSDAFMRQ